MTCAALILGLHMATAHVRTDLENFNPGAYVQCDQAQAGAYRNSIGRTTVYAGYVVQAGPVDVLVGAATGYRQALRPVFGAIGGTAGRLSGVVPVPIGQRIARRIAPGLGAGARKAGGYGDLLAAWKTTGRNLMALRRLMVRSDGDQRAALWDAVWQLELVQRSREESIRFRGGLLCMVLP